MDPYLENPTIWPVFHHELVVALETILRPGLLDRYQSSIGQRHYVTEATPGVDLHMKHHEQTVEIRQRSDGKLVTLLDVVSPANRTTSAGRSAYLATRREARANNCNLVEIDLVMQGPPMLDYSREGLPAWDYSVTVTRSTQPERYEIYTATIQKRLPRFRLPLAADDRDTVVDLQSVFTRAYENGDFGKLVDYSGEPQAPLTDESRRWLAELLKRPTFSHEEIAVTAYLIWQEQGCPDGYDREHWRLAIERLKKR
jgi:hypothetical protein